MRLTIVPGQDGNGAVIYVGDLVLTVLQVVAENGDVSYDVLIEGLGERLMCSGTVERAPEFVTLGMCGLLNESGQACSKDREHYRPHDFIDRPQTGRREQTDENTAYNCDTCGAVQTVAKLTPGQVASTWRCDACGQEWTWTNA